MTTSGRYRPGSVEGSKTHAHAESEWQWGTIKKLKRGFWGILSVFMLSHCVLVIVCACVNLCDSYFGSGAYENSKKLKFGVCTYFLSFVNKKVELVILWVFTDL